MSKSEHKKICLATCSLSFYKKISKLASGKKVNIADLARTVFILIPREIIAEFPDPGDSKAHERLTQGTKKRKPRIQVRLPEFESASMIRKALACYSFIQEIDSNKKEKIFKSLLSSTEDVDQESINKLKNELFSYKREIETLQNLVREIHLTNLNLKISTKEEAYMIFGFSQDYKPSLESAHKRYKKLATAFHPDGLIGNNEKMAQINSAWKIIKNHIYHYPS